MKRAYSINLMLRIRPNPCKNTFLSCCLTFFTPRGKNRRNNWLIQQFVKLLLYFKNGPTAQSVERQAFSSLPLFNARKSSWVRNSSTAILLTAIFVTVCRVLFFQVKNKSCLGCSKNYVDKMRWVGSQKIPIFIQVQGKKYPCWLRQAGR